MQFPFKNPCALYDTSKIGGELSTYNEWIETQLEQETVNHSNFHISDPSLISLPQESSTPIEQLEMSCSSQDDNRLNESPTTETMESTINQPTELTQCHNVKSCTGQLNPSQDGHHDDDLPSIHVELETNQNGAQNSSLPSNNSDDQFTSSNRPEVELSRNHNMVTQAQRGITKPNPRYAYLHKEIPTEPKTVISALKNDGWKAAMHEELHALKINDTWDIVQREAHMNVSTFTLYAFSDADWAGCPITRRFTTGYCTLLGGNCISWCAKKQPTISLSSAEAEYKSMASTTAEITWLTYLLQDIGIYIPNPPILHCDNISALHMTVNHVFHGRTKHVEMDYHFVREKVAFGNLVTQYVSSSSQLADIFTKPLPRTSFNELRTKLGLSLLPRPSLRGSVNAFDG
ncbi:hypothetical protein SLEP1_g38002 [Rubroshorea leprosula]|uniref:Uncharacterized protein n=1 Tax=Rubroshorea leprosula TaxID=152421 RepID=A0AAV5KWT6_9ROSI|nr:hypothetical protein SLEP1_g38002 [Rubroshorea leprosula]